MPKFEVVSPYQPSGDQPEAIDALAAGIENGLKEQVLLGVTGSGKTYTMAKVIEKVQRPTLVLAHNKTLAAQLCAEFKEFFPNNAVEYFVSYYDYYQPEAYIPHTDTYIAKDASTNDEIDRLRLSATCALLERRDVIVVSSVSCIYGLGEPEDFAKMDNAISAAQISIGVSTDLAQMALSYYYAGKMKSRELEDIFIILSVIGQISIDLAKKNFEINVVNEINRIKRLSSMESGLVARFMADAKKIKNPKKKYSEGTVQRMNCPMDIMAEIIEEETIQYPENRKERLHVRKFFDENILKMKADNRKAKRMAQVIQKYNDSMQKIRTDYGLDEEDEAYFVLKNSVLNNALHKIGNKNIDQAIVMKLIIEAIEGEYTVVQNTMLNFLYQMAPELFLKCFVKNEQKVEENLQQNDEND